MSTIRTTARTGTARTRPYESTTVVFPAPGDTRADDVVTALEAVSLSARASAEAADRALRRAEVRRARAATALEVPLRPMSIDEAGRALLRDAYAAADREVAVAREAAERAHALESAASVIAHAVGDAADAAGADAARALVEALAETAPPARRRAARSARSDGAVVTAMAR